MDFAAAGTEHGAPFHDFHRADLHSVLLNRAIELGADIRTNSEVVDISFDDERSVATVLIKDQDAQVADLVIGADGINSRCREILLGRREPPHRTGDMAYRILLDAEDVRKDPELVRYLDEKAVNYWYGPGAHAGKNHYIKLQVVQTLTIAGSNVSPPRRITAQPRPASPGQHARGRPINTTGLRGRNAGVIQGVGSKVRCH